ncbi:MAG: hypothetical protein ACLFVJ_13065 [Persicimonas sp.]
MGEPSDHPRPPSAGSSAGEQLARYLRWPMPLAVIWVLAPVAGILIRLSLEPIGPHDYWWALAMGKLIALSGEIPSANHFLYTMPADAPFVDQPWLGQWAMYAAYDSFGHAGPLVMRNILAALAWAGVVVAGLSRCDDPRVVGGLALLTAAVSGPVFGVRTQMFAFLPYVVLVGVIVAVADRRIGRPWLLVLAPLCALWANVHGTFMLVPVLIGLAGGSLMLERLLEERRLNWSEAGWWTGAGVLCALAALANPQGPGIYTYVFELTFVSHVSSTVTEWQPPGVDTPLGIIVMLTLTASLVVMAIRRKHVRLFEAVLFAATAYLAVGAVRQMFWWGAVMLMVVPRHISGVLAVEPWWNGTTSRAQGIGHAVVVAILVAGGLLSQPGLAVHWLGSKLTEGLSRRSDPGQGVLSVMNPTGLVSGLEERGYPPRIFHDQAVGGYLDFALGIDGAAAEDTLVAEQARQVAFVDQRIELIDEEIWGEYFQLSRAEEGYEEIIERYGIRSMLLWPEEQWRLIQTLQADKDWALVGVDEGHLLFVHSDEREYITRWR